MAGAISNRSGRVAPPEEKEQRVDGSARGLGLVIVEGASVVAFVALQFFAWTRLVDATDGAGWAVMAAGIVLGWIAADAASGVVHYLADHRGKESWPWLGPAFIQPFREHHREPLLILEHGFLEKNGNAALIALPSFGWILLLEAPLGWLQVLLGATCLSLGLWVLFTNQIHAWAHAATVPRWVAWCQRGGIFLSPAAHARHHVPPYASHYCITSGLLDRFRLLRGGRAPSGRAPGS